MGAGGGFSSHCKTNPTSASTKRGSTWKNSLKRISSPSTQPPKKPARLPMSVPSRLALSAAVLADTATAERRHAQEWRAWVRAGLLDRVFVMCYARPVQTVLEQMVSYADDLGTAHVVPGIAVYNSGAAAAAAKIKGAVEMGYRAVAIYSYDALDAQPGYWDALAGHLGPRAAAPAGEAR